MRRIKTEPSLSLTPKEYMERREKEKALQAMHQVPYIFCKSMSFSRHCYLSSKLNMEDIYYCSDRC